MEQIDVSGYQVLHFMVKIPNAARYLEFVSTPMFERTRKGVLSDDDVRGLENELLKNPEAGDVVSGTGGVRKTRAANEGHGKRGSVRVAYLYVQKWETIFFLFPFPKNVQGNLTADQKRAIRAEIRRITAESWPRKKPKK
jgi:hypothetical protein